MGSMLLWHSSGRLQPCTTTFVAAAARFLHFFFHSVIRKKSWNASFHAKHFFRQNGNSNGNFCRRSPGNGASPLPETLLPPPDVDRSRLMLTDIYFVICQNFSANLGRSWDRRKSKLIFSMKSRRVGPGFEPRTPRCKVNGSDSNEISTIFFIRAFRPGWWLLHLPTRG